MFHTSLRFLPVFIAAAFVLSMVASAADKDADDLKSRMSALQKQSKRRMGYVEQKELIQELNNLRSSAASEFEYSIAVQAATLSLDVSRNSGNGYLAYLAQRAKDALTEEKKAHQKLKSQFKKLADMPDNPSANLEIGKFLCSYQQKWKTGCEHIAQSDDDAWTLAAKSDLQQPGDFDALVSLADAWTAAADTETGRIKSAALQRASEYAQRAFPQAKDEATKNRLNKILSRAPQRWLIDLEEIEVKPGPWPLGKGDIGQGTPITVGEVPSPRSLGLHPPSEGTAYVAYRLNGQYKTFVGGGALSDPGKAVNPIYFEVRGDGEVLWKSSEITQDKRTVFCSVNIKDVKILELCITCPGNHLNAYGCWIDPEVIRAE